MLNSTGNTTGCQPQSMHPFVPIFLSFIFFIGFVLNCISLWIFWFKVKEWNATVVLQFHLAISDTIITPAAPLMIIYYLTEDWTFGLFLCQFNVFLLVIHINGSIYFLTFISIHRYLSVAHNIKRSALIKKPYIKKLCFVVWGCLLCQSLPSFVTIKTSKVHGLTKCLSLYQTDQAVLFFIAAWVQLFFGFLVPFSIILVCYILLSRHLLRVNPLTSLSKVMVSKSVKTIFISLIIFIISYIPLHIVRTIAVTIMVFFPTSCSLLDNLEIADHITYTMFGTNGVMDPIVYCYSSDKFKHIFSSWFTGLQRWGKSSDDAHGNTVEISTDNHRQVALPSSSKETEL